MTCPLCRSDGITISETLKTSNIASQWLERYGIDVARELHGHDVVKLHHCRSCDLQFFDPALAGSAALYKALQHFDWYYMPRKWEHDMAIRDVERGDLVLEVGCGEGDFVRRLMDLRGVDARGIELNPDAVGVAREQGLPVELKRISDLRSEARGTFRMVCGFQVLEHVPDPSEFISSCVELLAPGGCLLLSVPNRDGFLRFARYPLLDQPPHHVTRWSRSVFEHISELFPLRLEKVLYEPLALYHLDWFVNVQLNRLPRIRYLTPSVALTVRRLLVPLARTTGFFRLFRGHTILCRYTKDDICESTGYPRRRSAEP